MVSKIPDLYAVASLAYLTMPQTPMVSKISTSTPTPPRPTPH
jgi:hypothetical protein